MYIVHCPHLVRAVFVELAQVPSCAKGQGSSAPHRRAPTPATPQAACRRRPVLERAPFDDPPRMIARGTFSASSMPNVDIEVSFQSARRDLDDDSLHQPRFVFLQDAIVDHSLEANDS